ncbi:MAG: hypothetical protein OEW84_08590, partial [Aigarchaeota archaeon]|nr:hypothetical protein [Aigarchaeota archaeon]
MNFTIVPINDLTYEFVDSSIEESFQFRFGGWENDRAVIMGSLRFGENLSYTPHRDPYINL